jgi:CDP-glycerol glycerophosphotransferase
MTNAGSSSPRVLALVPTWKAAGFIERTLDALAAQTCPGLAILISDDASPDGTAAICERRVAKDPRFRLVRQARNRAGLERQRAARRSMRRRLRAVRLQATCPDRFT